jgi:universal stress protein family protein
LTTVFDAALAESPREHAIAAAQVELERLANRLRRRGVSVTAEAVWGVPVCEAIAAAAREWRADLLVLGAHEPQLGHARLTATDWQLMSSAACPLLLVKHGQFDGYDSVAAVVDREGDGDAVLRAGRRLARAFGCALRTVDSGAPGAIGHAAGHRTCVAVARASNERELGRNVEAAASAPSGDVLLVPANP